MGISEHAPVEGQAIYSAEGVGELLLVWSAKGLVELSLPERWRLHSESEVRRYGAPPEIYARRLDAYFRGEPVDPVSLPVDPRGTPFQLRVWEALRAIPRGQVRSYSGVAVDVHAPRAMRAVGMANARNPIAIVVPCHRVVESGMRLGGYAGGLELKRKLLELEGVKFTGAQVLPGQLELGNLSMA